MIETICTPYGKAAFPAVVKCDGCGEVVGECGWFRFEPLGDSGIASVGYAYDDNEHYCDECADKLEHRGEFRICDRCGAVMTQGYVVGDTCIRLCEECFGPWMDENCEQWRENDHEGDNWWDGGCYDELVDGEWHDTGAYWTQWS